MKNDTAEYYSMIKVPIYLGTIFRQLIKDRNTLL